MSDDVRDERDPRVGETEGAEVRRRVPVVLALLPLVAVFVGLVHSPTEGSEVLSLPAPEAPDFTAPGMFRPPPRPDLAPVEEPGAQAADLSLVADEGSGAEVPAEGSGVGAAADEMAVATTEGTGEAAATGTAVDASQATADLMRDQCTVCHDLYDPADYDDAQWETWVRQMSAMTDLTESQVQDLIHYGQTANDR